jgi:hypothetical protein
MSSRVRRLVGVASAALALLVAGCGMEATHDNRRGKGEAVEDVPFAVHPEQEGWVCGNELPATDARGAGPCLKQLDSSMTCPSCKIQFRRRDEPDPTIADVAQVVDAVKAEADAPMHKTIDELKEELKKATEELKIDPAKVDSEFNDDAIIEQLKADKLKCLDNVERNPIERLAEIERMRWESAKKHPESGVFLKPGSKPLALPLLLCPNPDCKQPVDPASHVCRECKQGYIVAPNDAAVALKEPMESLCPWCHKPVDPTTNLCAKCDRTYRPVSGEGPCWRCGGAGRCPECGGSGRGVDPSSQGIDVCWACVPATGGPGDILQARGDGLCAECRGKGYLDYDPALPGGWGPLGNARKNWQLKGEPASTKPADSGKPEKDEGK